MTQLIFVVEDEPKIARLLTDYLAAAGYQTSWFDTGTGVVEAVRERAPDLMLLDIMLPGVDGMTICKRVRAFSQSPIIMLTARVEEIDRLLGLELGADDYICKPFSPKEVVARVKAVLRRASPEDKVAGLLDIDRERRTARAGGLLLDLTPNEFELLCHLNAHKGRVFSRNQLLDAIHSDFRDVSDRTVDSHIKNLRKKLAKALPDHDMIVSVYGVGYKLEL